MNKHWQERTHIQLDNNIVRQAVRQQDRMADNYNVRKTDKKTLVRNTLGPEKVA